MLSRMRLLFAGAVAVSLAALWGVRILIDGAENAVGWWLQGPLTALVAIFGSSAALLFLVTLFAVKGDPWDTWYFRYMRYVWGSSWGGKHMPFQISVCRANTFSAVTLSVWVVLGAVLTFLLYSTWALAFGDVGYLSVVIKHDPSSADFYGATIPGGLMLHLAVIVLLFITTATPWFRGGFSAEEKPYLEGFPDFLPVSMKTWCAIFLCSLVAVGVVAPIRFVGFTAYIGTVGQFLLGLFLVVIIAAAVIGVVVGTMMLSRTLYQHTVPGLLAQGKARSWKEKVCPLIAQGFLKDK